MRFLSILQMAKDYAVWGIIAAAALAAVYAIVYFFVYRKLLRGEKRPQIWQLIFGAVFVIYLAMVLGATMLSRFGGLTQGTVGGPFSSYLAAWYTFDMLEWRNLILNICMFLPFGFLVPILFEKFRVFWRTYLAGLAFTAAIESLQYVLKRGIFEWDDILNNLIGTMIGYGLAYAVLYFSRRRGSQKQGHASMEYSGKKGRICLLAVQIPLLCTVAFFALTFVIYEKKEYGNFVYEQKMHFKNMSVSCSAKLSDDAGSAVIYYLKKYSAEETDAFARKYFDRLGTSTDESRTDLYPDTAIYYSQNDEYNLWVEYRGLSYSLTDFSQSEETQTGASRSQIERALEKYDVQIPRQAIFEEEENGYYRFSVNMLRKGDILMNGSLQCRYMTDGEIAGIDQNIISYEKHSDCAVISEREAYEKIHSGACYSYRNCSGQDIQLSSVRLTYELDSKGYYRPVYRFSGEIGNEPGEISVSALAD